MKTILETQNMSISFGGLLAVDNVNIQIKEKELVGLIGPNGAGKTTIFNLLTGQYFPSNKEAKIYINNELVTNIPTFKRVKFGISRTFQNIRLFEEKTVLDNVKMALDNEYGYSIFDSIFRTKKYYETEKLLTKKALELLDIFEMTELSNVRAGNLSYGRQRKLEIVRALATNPKILLLDEPAAGMNPSETNELMLIIDKIRDRYNTAILLIEHDMGLVMGICERLYVLNFGKVIAEGVPEEIKQNKEVIKAYLGG